MSKKITLLLAAFSALSFFMSAQFALAVPVVTSFTANPQSIGNNYTTTLAWSAPGSSGASLLINCPAGVTFKKDGTAFPCGTRQQISSASSDSVGFVVTNVSGTTKGISISIYPKDSDGADYDAGSSSLTLTVSPSAQPLTSFTVSTTSIASGGAVTFTWTGNDITNSMIQFECADNLRVFNADPATGTVLPCGNPAYTTDFGSSGAVTVYPLSSSNNPVTLTARAIPGITTGLYDNIHALLTTLTVTPKPAAPTPSITSFSSSVNNITSGAPFSLSWNAQSATSTNLKFTCSDGLSISAITGTTTSLLPCGTPAFSPTLGAQGSTTLVVTSKNYYGSSLMATVMPQGPDGTYFQNSGRSLSFIVSMPSATTGNGTAPVQTTVATTPSSGGTTQTGLKHYNFTIPLKRGSQNADVAALQKFLAKDPALYPEGLVTGLFGPATERAVGRLQVKYKLANPGAAGYGTVGPNTRKLLNSIQ